MSAERELLAILEYKIRHDKLILPTLPEIALKVRRQAADPEVSLQQMAELISQDPSLSARMIKVANSAYMGRSIKVTTLNQAVTRIGLSQIRNIAVAMALEQVFVSQHKVIQQRLTALWQDSIHMASIAGACLTYYNALHRHSGLNPDVMTLAALIHNIGALPVLTEAERAEAVLGDPRFLHRLTDKLATIVGVKILNAWGFGNEFIKVVTSWRQLSVQQPVGYTDFLRLAAIAKDYYTDKEQQAQLLDYYVNQQLVPQQDFMQQPEIAAVYQDIRAIFS